MESQMNVIDAMLDRLQEAHTPEDQLKWLKRIEASLPEEGEAGKQALYNRIGVVNAVAHEAYKKKEYLLAERAFRLSAQNGNLTGKNNYAYMIWYGEAEGGKSRSVTEALRLLRDGVVQRSAFSIVNMSLALALRVGTEVDWQLADEALAELQPLDGAFAEKWGEMLDKKGGIEGCLLHFWLLRHHMIKQSALGTKDELLQRLKAELPGFPRWMEQ